MKNQASEMDKVRSEVGQILSWCMIVALNQEEGIGKHRFNQCAKVLKMKQKHYVQKLYTDEILGKDRNDAITEMKQAISGVCDDCFRVPQLRAPRNRKEEEILKNKNEAATIAWLLMAATVREVLHFGQDRFARLKKNTFDNYRQFLEWCGKGGQDEKYYAYDRLRRCVEQAIQEDVIIADDEDSPDVFESTESDDKLSAVLAMRIARNTAKKTSAANGACLLSEQEKRRRCLEIQKEFFGK